LIVGKGILRLLMAIRSVNFNYGIKQTTNLSGFLPAPSLFGMDSLWSAPGWGFLFGEQDAAIRFTAAEQGWITQTPFLTSPFMQSSTRNLSFNASIEPFKGLKIQLNGKRTSAGRYQEIFRYNSEIQEFGSLTPSRSGSYSISYLTIKSAFEAQTQMVNGVEFERSSAFDQFKENIDIISGRLSNSLEASGISDRYDTISQDILVPAFLAAYTGENAENAPMGVFPRIPIPNWRIDFAGLSKLPGLKDVFSSVNLTHSYRSIFSVNNYTNSLLYTEQMTLDNQLTDYPLASLTDSITGKLVPVYILNQVSILEQFAPLIGINIKTKTNLSASFNYKRDRNLALNLSNAQVTETQNSGVTFDFGWTKADLILPFKTKGRTITIKNDVTFRMAITFRDSKTVQRKLQLEEEGTENKITNGNKGFQIRPSLAYKLNKQLDLTMYYEKNTTTPRVGSYLRSTTSFGIQLRFNLAQ
jgi:cell surface protein SprA